LCEHPGVGFKFGVRLMVVDCGDEAWRMWWRGVPRMTLIRRST